MWLKKTSTPFTNRGGRPQSERFHPEQRRRREFRLLLNPSIARPPPPPPCTTRHPPLPNARRPAPSSCGRRCSRPSSSLPRPRRRHPGGQPSVKAEPMSHHAESPQPVVDNSSGPSEQYGEESTGSTRVRGRGMMPGRWGQHHGWWRRQCRSWRCDRDNDSKRA